MSAIEETPLVDFALGTYREAGGRPFAGIAVGSRILPIDRQEVGRPGGWGPVDMLELLDDWDSSLVVLRRLAEAPRGLDARFASDLDTLSPIPRPRQMLFAAANYGRHVAEMVGKGQAGPKLPSETGGRGQLRPYFFPKLPSCVIGPYETILLPEANSAVDWEVELGVVIGRPCRGVDASEALDYVAGYMVVNDLSRRRQLFRDDWPHFRSDWLTSKSFDTAAPLGPLLVPKEAIANPMDLELRLHINGELCQSANTGEMIFAIGEQIEFLSKSLTLSPGDVISTGTPAGVGAATGRFLEAGDVVEAEIIGLGRQRNVVGAAR